jgi:hypothetical protein
MPYTHTAGMRNLTMEQELPEAHENITVHAFINSHTKEHSQQLTGFYQQ